MRTLIIVLIVCVFAVPAGAVDSAMVNATAGVIQNAATPGWERMSQPYGVPASEMRHFVAPVIPPTFKLTKREVMAVVAIGAEGAFADVPVSQIAIWVQKAAIRYVAAVGPQRGLAAYEGTPCPGQLVLEITVRAVAGEERHHNSSVDETDYRHTSDEHRRTVQVVYLTLQPVIYRLTATGGKEIVAASAARISASESVENASFSARTFRIDYQRYYAGRWLQHRSNSFGFERDANLDREVMVDSLSQRLAQESVVLSLQELAVANQHQQFIERATVPDAIRVVDVDGGEVWLNAGHEKKLVLWQTLIVAQEIRRDPENPSRIIRVVAKARLKIERFRLTPGGDRVAVCSVVQGSVEAGDTVFIDPYAEDQ
ncbi:MAG: hypothetical protein BWY68_00017 [bacterium ADurb.Bin400]|nr:MAG: hypothetical protein BWY68_00017 [bacterium ADurb.Bin400]